MSTVRANQHQIGQSATVTDNGTWYQPTGGDGTIRYAVGPSTAKQFDALTINGSGKIDVARAATIGTNLTVSGNTSISGSAFITGKVGVGTSSPSSDAIVKFVDVNDATSAGLVLTAARKFSIYSSSSSTLAFRDETAATARMVIDSSGRITIPAQPCFYAYGSGSNPTATGTVQNAIFTTAQTNVGSCYNTSNGRFTAPVAGNYMFSFYLVQNGVTGGPLAYLLKNGSSVSAAVIFYGTSYNNASGTMIISLAANDYVTVGIQTFNGASALIDLNYSGFCGHLIG